MHVLVVLGCSCHNKSPVIELGYPLYPSTDDFSVYLFIVMLTVAHSLCGVV